MVHETSLLDLSNKYRKQQYAKQIPFSKKTFSHQNSRSKNETLSTKKKEETDYDKNTNLEINKYKIKEFYMLSITSEYYH